MSEVINSQPNSSPRSPNLPLGVSLVSRVNLVEAELDLEDWEISISTSYNNSARTHKLRPWRKVKGLVNPKLKVRVKARVRDKE